MRSLIDGFLHFKNHVYPRESRLFAELGHAQHPQALFITCADSRIDPSLITQSKPGELFVCRTIGNQVPPYGVNTDGGVASAIEYALEVLQVREIIVCGHSDCGAMKVVLEPERAAGLPATSNWLKTAVGMRSSVINDDPNEISPAVLLERITEANIVAQLRNLCTHPSVARKITRGEVELHGWNYDIHSGEISCYNSASRVFGALDTEFQGFAFRPVWRRIAQEEVA